MLVPDASETGSLYVGLISGTSMDGIDAAVVRIGEHDCRLLATHTHLYPQALQTELLRVSRDPDHSTVDDVGRLDRAVGECFRDAANALMAEAGVDPGEVIAIGSHGQTLRHLPHDRHPFTLQIGDPNVIASGTGVTTVADFRRRDLAAGGEGAPLTPAFHRWLFADSKSMRVILNIGGIANVTLLPPAGAGASGFDTGPGNTLLDAWIRERRGEAYDTGGRWAASGRVSGELLKRLLADDYFDRDPPKSTGFEHFNIDWLASRLAGMELSARSVQATLLELTVRTICDAVTRYAPDSEAVIVCGGGVHNAAMMSRLRAALSPLPVTSTEAHGLDPDWVEAAAFAWLASRTLAGAPGNLPAVTGAGRPEVLGGIYLCTREGSL